MMLKIIIGLTFLFTTNNWAQKNDGDYRREISRLEAAEKEDSQNWKIKRDLGIAHYKNDQFNQAAEKFDQCFQLYSKDPKMLLYMGLNYESLAEYRKAAVIYKYMSTQKIESNLREEIKRRQTLNQKKHWEEELTRKINQKNGTTGKVKPNSIAVLYFRNISNWAEFEPIVVGLAELFTFDLGKVKILDVSERQQVQTLLTVLNNTPEQLYDDKEISEIGKLLNVKYLVTGGIERVNETNMRLSAGVVETQTGHLIGNGCEIEGPVSDITKLQKRVTARLIRDLALKLSETEQKSLNALQTKKSLAFIAFSKALAFEDENRFEDAKVSYKKAIRLDKKFKLAIEKMENLPSRRLSNTELEKLVSNLN